MKRVSILLFFCSCTIYCRGQLLLPDTIYFKEELAANKKIAGYYPNGNQQYEGYKNKSNLHGPWNSWYSNGQLLDSGSIQKGVPDGIWVAHYKNGSTQFIRTYSSDKWQQFQNEKGRYHPKRISMPLTRLFHENKAQADNYITAINTLCAQQNCTRVKKEDLIHRINSSDAQDHYHPVFENGLLHGPFINYFPDGTIKDSGKYRDGLPEGLWIKWTIDKQFYWEGYYQHGMKNKEWKLYSANRRLIRIVSYRQGKYMWRKDMKEVVGINDED